MNLQIGRAPAVTDYPGSTFTSIIPTVQQWHVIVRVLLYVFFLVGFSILNGQFNKFYFFFFKIYAFLKDSISFSIKLILRCVVQLCVNVLQNLIILWFNQSQSMLEPIIKYWSCLYYSLLDVSQTMVHLWNGCTDNEKNKFDVLTNQKSM